MTDMELAEEIEQAAEHGDRGYERVWFTANGDLQIRCRNPEEIQAIIAALRRGPERLPSGERLSRERIHEWSEKSLIECCGLPPEHAIFLMEQCANDLIREVLSAAEASKEAK